MNKLHYRKTRLMMTLVAIPVISLFIAVNSQAFTDMNDSAAQVDVVKLLQKRIDSLEVRFEKGEISRNESKKMALDWNRGMFLSLDFGVTNFLDLKMNAGYKFHRKHRDGTSCSIGPVLQLGPRDWLVDWKSSDTLYPMSAVKRYEISFGIQKSARILDRVSYSTAWLLTTIPGFDEGPKLYGIGGGWNESINFWFNEKSSVGLGHYTRTIINWEDSWSKGIGYNFLNSLYIQYTYNFAKHDEKSR